MIVPLYAALLAALFIVLSVRVIGQRRRVQAAIGDAGDAALARAIRVHANFAEYVPLALLLLWMLESAGGAALLLHALGALLLVARVVHALGVSNVSEDLRLRVVGMTGTFAVIAIAALALLVQVLRAAG